MTAKESSMDCPALFKTALEDTFDAYAIVNVQQLSAFKADPEALNLLVEEVYKKLPTTATQGGTGSNQDLKVKLCKGAMRGYLETLTAGATQANTSGHLIQAAERLRGPLAAPLTLPAPTLKKLMEEPTTYVELKTASSNSWSEGVRFPTSMNDLLTSLLPWLITLQVLVLYSTGPGPWGYKSRLFEISSQCRDKAAVDFDRLFRQQLPAWVASD